MEQPKSGPWSYDAMKSVLKSMSVEKRQEIHRRIPQLRTTNSVVPYRVEHLSLGDDYIAINEKFWWFNKVETSDGDEDAENKVIVKFGWCSDEIQQYKPKERFRNSVNSIQLKKSPEDAYDQLFDTFLKNGTVIDKLILAGAPESLDKKNCDNWKIGVSSIVFPDGNATTSYDRISRFLDLEQLECMEFPLTLVSMKFLDKPEVINCKSLLLSPGKVDDISSFGNHLNHLMNEHLMVVFPDYSDVEPLVKVWIESPRPVPSRFSFIYWFGNEDPEYRSIEKNFGAVPAVHPSDAGLECRSLKLSDGNDLIMYYSKNPQRFTMEVYEGGLSTEEADEGEPSEKRARQ